jgi:rhamnosyltransferase
MSRLVVVAHYDPRGAAAPHFLRQLAELRANSDEVIVASPSALTDEAAAAIEEHATLLRRNNYGHDFGSWLDALQQRGYAQDFDELLLTNDSYVGYFRPLEHIVAEMSQRPCEVWGMTKSWRHGEHIQSYFLWFSSPALHSQAFRRFWMDATPAVNRTQAILEQEVGISSVLREAGFALDSYFSPTLRERRLGVRRGVHWLRQRKRHFPARFDTLEDSYFDATRRDDPRQADYLNWSSAFADSALDDARLPVSKFDTFRFDPYWLGAGSLLTALERRFPAQMQGVRDYLTETSVAYQRRQYENHGFAKLALPDRLRVGYAEPRPARVTRERGTL